jgi:prophage regulatory protein
MAVAAQVQTPGGRHRPLVTRNQAGRAAIGVAGGLALATYQGERLLSQKAVISITSLSRTEIGRRVRANLFPKPVAIGPHRIAFRESEIKEYVAKMIQGETAAFPTVKSGGGCDG